MVEVKILVLTFLSFSIVENFINFKVVEGKRGPQKDNIEELIQTNGFTCETYEVETQDYYRLKIHRFKTKNLSPTSKILGPVFFMHGLFATAADYLITGANSALPFLLSTNGYDVWLGNSRGNDHSLKHKFLTTQSRAYWNFSFHEIGYYDVPAMFDFMLTKTNSSRGYYIGHSQGGASLMVMLSTRPTYNKKIIQAHLMAPAVFMKNLPNPFIRFFSSEFNSLVERSKSYDFFSTSQIMKSIESMSGFFCQQNSLSFNMCTNTILFVCGYNEFEAQIDPKVIPTLTKHLAHAVSTKQIDHFLQLYKSGKFQQYSYGRLNKIVYNQTTPPEYNLKNVIAPIYIYSGISDSLVAEKDIERLAQVLPNVKNHRIVRNYNHCDFNYGTNSRKFIFSYILKSMQQNE